MKSPKPLTLINLEITAILNAGIKGWKNGQRHDQSLALLILNLRQLF